MGRVRGDYAGALERELGFDRQLAERAREDLAEYLDEMARHWSAQGVRLTDPELMVGWA